MFFFFQAEDGIRDYKVTGVQTCALPISARGTLSPDRPTRLPARGARTRFRPLRRPAPPSLTSSLRRRRTRQARVLDRKSTRLNSSHLVISYAVFCLKKKKTQHQSGANVA